MPDLTVIPAIQTMTSRQIAELTDKRHDHVMRDIRNMLARLHGESSVPRFGDTFKELQNGQEYPIFILPKDETFCLIAGYDVKSRMAIIKRWKELENKQFIIPTTLSGALRLAAEQAEQIEQLQIQAKADAPKVEFAMAVRNMQGACKLGDFGKVIGVGRNTLFSWLREDEILMGDNMPYQKHVDSGLFVVSEQTPFIDRDGKAHPTFTTYITGKGQVVIEKKYHNKAGD